MSNFAHVTAPQASDEAYSFDLPDDLSIWGINGGVLAAVALRSAGAAMTAHARPVSLACNFLRPVQPGRANCNVDILKDSRSAGLGRVSVEQNGHLCTTADVWVDTPATGPVHRAHRPRVSEPSAVAAYKDHPFFWKTFDMRVVDPEALHSTAEPDVRAAAWFRYHDRETSDAFLGAARMLPLLDTLGMTAFRRGYGTDFLAGAAPTLQLTAHFFRSPEPDEWMLCESSGDSADAGLISSRVRIWSERGLLLAQAVSQARQGQKAGSFTRTEATAQA